AEPPSLRCSRSPRGTALSASSFRSFTKAEHRHLEALARPAVGSRPRRRSPPRPRVRATAAAGPLVGTGDRRGLAGEARARDPECGRAGCGTSMRALRTREDWEREERERLAPWAVRSAESRGRIVPEPEHPYRSAFQRDRDRIVHSRAFRRLEYKTQV